LVRNTRLTAAGWLALEMRPGGFRRHHDSIVDAGYPADTPMQPNAVAQPTAHKGIPESDADKDEANGAGSLVPHADLQQMNRAPPRRRCQLPGQRRLRTRWSQIE